ncbi:MAG: Uma2 family endonuclease [Calditrichaeota bacterium]|nr:MAG: Uma2 family endonuclease [Calditrichota bacterium]
MDTSTKEKLTTLPQTKYMTEEEFLDFCDEDIRAEFIDGEVIVFTPASNKHSSIQMFIGWLIQLYVAKNNLGKVWGENFQVRLRPGLRLVPDLIYVSKENKVKITETEIEGAPDLVVEIVSPDSVDRDWRDKYYEYQQAKVKEYWIIDPNTHRLEIYCLDNEGKYVAQKSTEGTVKSKILPGFWMKPEWLWQEPLPNVITIAKELNITI